MNITFADLTSLQLALWGMMVSVLAMVFAIVAGKRDELRTLRNMNDTLAKNRKVALGNSLAMLTHFCRRIISILVALLLMYFGSMVLNNMLSEDAICLAIIIDTILTFSVLVWVVVTSAIIWNKINRD